MNKQTKMILGIAAVGVAGYLIYKSMNKPKANAIGRTGRLAVPTTTLGGCVSGDEPACNLCGDSCVANVCYVAVYDSQGRISHYKKYPCRSTTDIG